MPISKCLDLPTLRRVFYLSPVKCCGAAWPTTYSQKTRTLLDLSSISTVSSLS